MTSQRANIRAEQEREFESALHVDRARETTLSRAPSSDSDISDDHEGEVMEREHKERIRRGREAFRQECEASRAAKRALIQRSAMEEECSSAIPVIPPPSYEDSQHVAAGPSLTKTMFQSLTPPESLTTPGPAHNTH